MTANYSERALYYSKFLKKVTSHSKLISLLRLILFVIAALSIYLASVYATVTTMVLVIFISIFAFIVLVRYHSNVLERLRLLEAYKQLNENENRAMAGDHSSFPNGEEYLNADHPYANDIDLFGDGSLFQALNRTVTEIGTQQLAKKLSNCNTNKNRIIELQDLIGLLAKQFEWRQKFQAIGLANKEGKNAKERIMEWVKLPALFEGKGFLVLVILIPVLTSLFTTLLSFNIISFQNYLLYLAVPWSIAGAYIKRTNTRHSLVSKSSDMLSKYSLLLSVIKELKLNKTEQMPEDLRDIDSNKAGKQLKVLSSIMNALDNRLNPISWTLLNAVFLWDILQMLRLEKWQKKNQENLASWFYLIAEMDALTSLANFNFNQSKATIPKFSSDDEVVVARKLGHLLIDKKIRVDNDVSIKKGTFVLITGANMAGKSTYLRTIATSLVLATNGCVVPAESFVFSPIQLYTSIRTQDSLQKNESYFYAELKRLKNIIDELRSGRELVIILDEILKGTNSKDKHHGSEALLKQLIHFKSSGIVATHDIMLGELEQSFPAQISNYCFEVEINDDHLDFDYTLRKGVSQNMNATLLMRQMGITV